MIPEAATCNSWKTAFGWLSILRALWRRKGMIATLWLAGTAGVAALVLSLTPLYRADTLVLVEPQKIPETFVAATVQVILEARLDMLKQQVLSRDRLWSLIEEFHLYPEERDRHTQQEIVQLMRDDLDIALERGWSASRPGAFRVAYYAPDPLVAAEVANRIGQFFIDENQRQREAEAASASDFLDSQLAESQSHLREQEARLSAFKLQYNGQLPSQEAALLAELAQTRAELSAVQDSLARAGQNKLLLESTLTLLRDSSARRRDLLRLQQEQRDTQTANAPEAPPAPTELDNVRATVASLRVRYLDAHPEVQAALRRLRQLEERERKGAAASAAPARPSPVPSPAAAANVGEEETRIAELTQRLEAVGQELDALREREQRVLAQSASVQARIRRIPVSEQALASITRDYETSNTNYASLLSKKLAAETAANMERQQKSQRLVMLEAARVPEKPAWPRRRLLIGAGSAGSLGLALMLAFLLELRRNVVLGEWELAAGTVVLARIPVLNEATARGRRAAAGAALLLVAALAGPPLWAQSAPDAVPVYRIGPGDVLRVVVWKEPDAGVDAVTVQLDGMVSLPLIGQVTAGGLTPIELQRSIAERFSSIILDPRVSVIVTETVNLKVYVLGEVRREGSLRLQTPLTVLQALAEAGGLTDYAHRKNIYILRKSGGRQLTLPFDYNAVVKGRKMEQNVTLLPGDTVVVPR